MTTAPIPASAAAPPMAHTPDSQPAPPARTEAAAPDGAGSRAAGRTRLRDQIAANPLLSLFGAVLAGMLGFMGTVVIALLAYTLATTDDRFAEVNDRFVRLEDKVDAGFAAQDAKIDEINLKLTALIAASNMAHEVDAALQGTLLDSATASTTTTGPR